MLPNMSRTIMRFAIAHTIKKVTKAVVNHRPTETTQEVTVRCVVQSASPTLLSVLDVDTSLRYYQVHTTDMTISEDDTIVINGGSYRLIKGRHFEPYGYIEFIAEEIKT